jgi:DNA modification methylase
VSWRIVEGECVEAMRAMPEASVDAVVCDPPYGLGFMGKEWDTIGDTGRGARARSERAAEVTPNGQGHSTSAGPYLAAGVDSLRSAGVPFQSWCETWAREALRVLKPGGHLLAFGGTRTYHRLACAIEDAGFELRDNLAWQHMESVFCGCDDPRRADGGDDVRGVRTDVQDVAADLAPSEAADVFAPVQRPSPGRRVGEARSEGTGGLDGCEPRELSAEDDRLAQSGLEGWRHAEACEGQLSRGAIRPGAGVGAADGASGRLHDGAPAGDGADRGTAAVADGGGASSRPRAGEQHAEQSGAMAVEWIPQGGGAWPGCPRCGKPLAPPFFGGPLSWEYGSGFPKSLDVSKAIDKAAGVEREPGVEGPYSARRPREVVEAANAYHDGVGDAGSALVTLPATPDAERWQGWGTALKPAHEPVVVARKPLVGTVARNVLAHGTGALNIDRCRIGTDDTRQVKRGGANDFPHEDDSWTPRTIIGGSECGRWPANVILDEEAAAMLDEQTGALTSGDGNVKRATGADRNGNQGAAYGSESRPAGSPMVSYGDTGGASRFFYCAKTSSAERNAGLDGFEAQWAPTMGNGIGGKPHDEDIAEPKRNVHPTVKPIDLMRWLVRLVTPPGGTVLDPFTGSGTTGIACALERFEFVGIEREAEYAAIARARLAWWSEHPDGMELVRRLEAEREVKAKADAGQLDLFAVAPARVNGNGRL